MTPQPRQPEVIDLDRQSSVTELPIYSLEAELAVLGCMLLQPEDCCQVAIDTLRESDFFVPTNRRVFALLSAMWSGNRPIESKTVAMEGVESRVWADVGHALGSLADIMDACGTHHSLLEYCRRVKEKSQAGEVQELGMDLVRVAQQGNAIDLMVMAERVAKRLDAVTVGTDVPVLSGPDPWEEYLRTTVAGDAEDSEGQVLATGYGHFDAAVKFRGGHVLVLAAVQKHGKSTLAFNFAARWWGQGIPGCVCSLEMRMRDLQTLIISNVSGITRDDLEARKLSSAQADVLFKSVARAKDWPYAIFDRPALTAREFRILARDQARRGAKFLVLDYFQLLSSERGIRQDRHLELEEMMRVIKCTALETGLAIVLISQLNAKSVDGKENNRPTLANLRGTGAIAQDADVVMLLSEPNPRNRPNGMRSLIGAIEANRRGPEQDIQWLFDGPHARFLEC